MEPITPLGKPLSQNLLNGTEIPFSNGTVPGVPEKPISAFQWIGLVRAIWVWIFRPLWYICFVWPVKLLIPATPTKEEEERREIERREHRRQQEMLDDYDKREREKQNPRVNRDAF